MKKSEKIFNKYELSNDKFKSKKKEYFTIVIFIRNAYY